MNFKFSNKLAEFLARPGIEGVVLHPYLDSVQIPTIGIGTIFYPDGRKVTMKDPSITIEQAYEYCLAHLNKIVLPKLNDIVTVSLNQNQIDALGSLAYNIGTGQNGLAGSSVLRSINNGDSSDIIHTNWCKWNKAGGKILKGLVTRREEEFKYYTSPC